MTISGQNGVLHTKSSYFSGSYTKGSQERKEYYLSSKINADFLSAKQYAEEQEQKFYHIFFNYVNTFEQFIAEMRKIFSGAEKDGQRIRSLSNANISSVLGDGNISLEQQLEYKIIIKTDSIEIPFHKLESSYVSVQGGDKYINIDSDLFSAKQVATWLRNNPDIKNLTKTNPGQFQSKSKSSTGIKKWFHEELEISTADFEKTIIKELGKSGVFLQISSKPKEETIIRDGFVQIALDFPLFQRKPSEIKELLKNSTEKYKIINELKEILKRIKNYLFNQCLHVNDGCKINGKNILKAAAERAWRQTIGDDVLFFFVGGGFDTGLKGQIGELQLDIITQYTLLCTSQTNPTLGHIIGGIVDGARQQPRSDYQLIVELGGDVGSEVMGIQVKNYNESGMKKVTINTDLGLIAPNLGDGFVDTLANAQFNESIGINISDIKSFLSKFLNTYFWKAMNLNVGEGLNPLHTNTFYWMGGTAIVPASKIISTIQNKQAITNPNFSISGFKKPSKGDADFSEQDGKGIPNFIEYWHGNQYIDWEVTDKNISSYSEYLSGVKVKTKFNMLSILNANGGINLFEFL